jgi:hypothetical protein
MKPRAIFLSLALLALGLGLAATAQSANPANSTPPGGAPASPSAGGSDANAAGTDAAGTSDLSGDDSDLGNIDQILEGEEEVLAGGGYSYDPGNRRDPFKSLLVKPDRLELKGPRPEGIPGLLIDEVDLTGIFRTKKGYVAQVKAANQNKSYLLREGDQLYDGDVVSISRSEVVFKQIVQDPTALKPFREVRKPLGP